MPRWILAALLMTLAGCATPNHAGLERLREGMDKDAVLETAGNPRRTFRTNGQDHWIYVYFEKNEEFSRQLSFEEGKLVKVGRPMAKQNWGKELESLKKTENFKPIDGGP
ncbi:MAG TPA: outer membrane protein assembly factor BamE [Bdellovibrionales bacterium]|nr:outer membrane protein assembly factor BamE [Bdellovibrionales bacterium]